MPIYEETGTRCEVPGADLAAGSGQVGVRSGRWGLRLRSDCHSAFVHVSRVDEGLAPYLTPILSRMRATFTRVRS